MSVAACAATTEPGSSSTSFDPALGDGEQLALVIVGRSDSDELTVGIDIAEALHGEEALRLAVADGVIGEGEELPNDLYIRNPDTNYELLQVVEGAEILMIPAESIEATITVSPAELAQLWEGAHPGQLGFHMAPLKPLPMMIAVSGGRIVRASEVYLPR